MNNSLETKETISSKEVIRRHITIEGIDGSGKSTFCKRLSENIADDSEFKELNSKYKFIFDRSPYHPQITKEIREMLANSENKSPIKLFDLFMEDNAIHAIDIKNNLDNNSKNIIITDRYITSTFAYQSLDIPFQTISKVYEESPINEPGLIIYFDINPEVAMERINARNEKKEMFEKLDKLKMLRENYKKVFNYYLGNSLSINNRMKIETVDANLSEDIVYEVAKKILINYLKFDI